jgi:DNA topoisomerase IB
VIPPAWKNVWICAKANGHLQVTGIDARGRKYYRYHKDWRAVRDETKYERIMSFAHTVPRIRIRVENDLKLSGLPREKVLAAVVKLLEVSLIRIGNEEYIHPTVISKYLDGTPAQVLRRTADAEISAHLPGLKPEEAAVLALLRQELDRRS